MANINIEELSELDARLNENVPGISWCSAAASHVGRVRKVNEDAFLCAPEQALWTVADGMGGHSRGDYASKVVVDSLLHFTPRNSLVKGILDLDVRLKTAHDICRNTFPDERVGSTVAALYVYANYCFFIWAGDSRVYRLRDDELEQMTCDHTVAQEKVARGELSQMMAAMDPSAHILTRAVGVNQSLYLGLHYTPVQPGDRYLICSDGLYNDLERKEIQSLLGSGSPEESVGKLIACSLDAGGRDNATAVVLEVGR